MWTDHVVHADERFVEGAGKGFGRGGTYTETSCHACPVNENVFQGTKNLHIELPGPLVYAMPSTSFTFIWASSNARRMAPGCGAQYQ